MFNRFLFDHVLNYSTTVRACLCQTSQLQYGLQSNGNPYCCAVIREASVPHSFSLAFCVFPHRLCLSPMSLSLILKNIYSFLHVLEQAHGRPVAAWDAQSLDHAFRWATYCEQVGIPFMFLWATYCVQVGIQFWFLLDVCSLVFTWGRYNSPLNTPGVSQIQNSGEAVKQLDRLPPHSSTCLQILLGMDVAIYNLPLNTTGGHFGGGWLGGHKFKSGKAAKRMDRLAPNSVHVCGFIWEWT